MALLGACFGGSVSPHAQKRDVDCMRGVVGSPFWEDVSPGRLGGRKGVVRS